MPTDAPRPAKPTKEIFDSFNSSATGHQRANNVLSGSTSWRKSRSLKLNNQFTGGAGGGKRVSDTVGAGSLDFGKDGRTVNGGWEKGAKGLRTGGQQSIFETMQGVKVEKDVERPPKRLKTDGTPSKPTCLVNPFTPFTKADGSIRETSWTSHESTPSHLLSPIDRDTSTPKTTPPNESEIQESDVPSEPPQIFANVTVYINGSTAPLISDHKLKSILSNHGGQPSIALGRKTVTHVIVGRPSSNGVMGGGGLSGSKLQKEVSRKCGYAVHFVTAEWIIESVKAGKRLPESKFEALKLAPSGVTSVASMFDKTRRTKNELARKEEGG